jgi:hypothetical protein
VAALEAPPAVVVSMPTTSLVVPSLAGEGAELAPALPDPAPAPAPPGAGATLMLGSENRGKAPAVSVEADSGAEQATARNVRAKKERMDDYLDLETLPYQTRPKRRCGCLNPFRI